ncbi:response regulator transcription factor [Intestinimonas sp. HCP28S3_D6]|uniref:response regulator transcription factor n=1 Tax=Intestinimonas sp. HCP28S3_D6 TaxID=3438942 RepID=UPI003F89A744
MIRILVAEDFDLIREDLCDTLEQQEDMTVMGSASTGADIQALALERDFDLILMDIEMETTTAGIRATERILEQKPAAKILFLTAHETDNMILTSMGAGAVDYIVKGCDDAELFRHIRSAYAGQPLLDGKIQNLLLKEYSRLRTSERSLLFFISTVSQLTTAERELVRLLLEDRKIKEIAAIRCVEVVTVKTQIKSLLHKFGCTRTKEIVNTIRELNVTHLF